MDFDLVSLRGGVQSIVNDMEVDRVAVNWRNVQAAKVLLREIETAMKDRAIEYMKANDLDVIELSTTEWLQLQQKSTDRQAPAPTVLRKLIDATAGDAEKIGACLSSGAFKPATSRKALELAKVDATEIKALFWKEYKDEIILVEHNSDETKFIRGGK